MLYWLFQQLAEINPGFNVFAYITLRTILGALTALLASLLLGPWFIRRLENRQVGQPIRKLGPESHLLKAGTPTMGGALILFSIVLATLLWADLSNRYVWVVLSVTLVFRGADCDRSDRSAPWLRLVVSFSCSSIRNRQSYSGTHSITGGGAARGARAEPVRRRRGPERRCR